MGSVWVALCLCGATIAQIVANDTSPPSRNVSSGLSSLDPNPIPKGFGSRFVDISKEIQFKYNDIFTLLVGSATKLSILPYEAEMSLNRFQWPRDDPDLEIEFTSLSESPLQVRHQLWGLYACAAAFKKWRIRLYPTFCYFGPKEPYMMGKIAFWARKPSVRNSSDPGVSVFARAESTDITSLSTEISSPATKTDYDVSDRGHRSFEVGFPTSKKFMSSTVALSFINFVTACAVAMKEGTAFLYDRDFTSGGLTIAWRLAPRAPRTSFLEWKDLAGAIAAVIRYMWSKSAFNECSFQILFDNYPTLIGKIRAAD